MAAVVRAVNVALALIETESGLAAFARRQAGHDCRRPRRAAGHQQSHGRPRHEAGLQHTHGHRHQGEERPDRWPLSEELVQVGERWGIDPARDLAGAPA